LSTHPGGVIGGPFPFGWVRPLPGSEPDGWSSWPVASLDPFVEVPDDAPGVPWLGEEAEEEPVVVVVGDEAVVVVEGFVPESVGEAPVVVGVPAVVVELTGEGAVVVTAPSEGVEAAGADVVPTAEAGPPASGGLGAASGGLGALTAAELTEKDGGAFEDGATVLAATVCASAVGAAAPMPGCGPGWVAPASGLDAPDPNG
jgi:hypothetical protein